MSDLENMKEVQFDEYCKTCLHKDKDEEFKECAECLDEPVRQYSHRPAKWVATYK